MAALANVTLRDGSQVRKILLQSTYRTLVRMEKVENVVLQELIAKCRDVEYKFKPKLFGDSIAILREYGLMSDDEDERVYEEVKMIVLNSVAAPDYNKLIDPLKPERISKA